jgi:hypothetical protein
VDEPVWFHRPFGGRGGRLCGVEPVTSSDVTSTGQRPVRLTGRDAFWLHVTLTAGLIVCGAAFAFELWRALDGHTFSWMYVFEWPIFAGFAIYMWWNLLQGHDRTRRPSRTPTLSQPVAPPDEELQAWNRYVRQLNADEQNGLSRPV